MRPRRSKNDNHPHSSNNPDMHPVARRWLSRLAMAFIVIAAVLAWEGYQSATGRRGPVPQWRILLYFLAAAMAVTLGLEGLRQRHRRHEDDEVPPPPNPES